METRIASEKELEILTALVANAEGKIANHWQDGLQVAYMDAAHTGGLYLYPSGIDTLERAHGADISEVVFEDADGVEVVATLSVDTDGNFLELDIWKWDMSSLVEE